MRTFSRRVLLAAGPRASGDYTSGLLHWWKMNEAFPADGATVLSVHDSGTGGLNGQNGVWLGSGAGPPAYSSAASFAGSDGDYISLPSAPFNWAGGGSYSIGGWVKMPDNTWVGPTGTDGQRIVYFDPGGYGGGPTTPYIQLANQAATPGGLYINTADANLHCNTTAFHNNTWNHMILTNQGGGGSGTFTLYVDAVVRALTVGATGDGRWGFGSPSYYFGMPQPGLEDGYYKGWLSSWRIYSRALSQADVTALVAAGG